MSRRTLLFLIVGVAVFGGYGALLVWILTGRGLPLPGPIGVVLLACGVAVQASAAVIYGRQFRHAVAQTGRDLRGRAAIRAALIGSGVARLLPAGGAVTPVAMSWAVRSEARGTAGAAVRVTTLNYAGLLIGTGGVLLWIALRDRFPLAATAPATVLGIVGLVVGGALMVGSTRLGALGRRLPERIRRRMESVFEDHAVDRRALLLLSSRIVCEAAVLGFVVFAFGIRITPAQVFAVFGISQLVGGLPGTPGGIGLIEAGMVGALVLVGVPAEVSLAPTLVYRVISYWLPVAGGLVAGGLQFLKARDVGSLEAG
jgi:uncharacterized membrane protein YbhN (UPF0104 family)